MINSELPAGTTRERFRRTLVLGSGGAGKSTLARQLGRQLDLPVVHLDLNYWKPGWVESGKEEWEARCQQIIAEDSWVIDGNFSGTLPRRIERATAVIFLDFPRLTCMRRLLRRLYQYRGRNREDLPEGCPEQLDWEFMSWVWNYPRRSRPIVLSLMEQYREKLFCLRLKSPLEVDSFLEQIALLLH